MPETATSLFIVSLLGFAVLICLPALLVGIAVGRKAALIVAVSGIFVGVPVILLGFYLLAAPKLSPLRASTETPTHRAAPGVVVDLPIMELPQDPTVQAFATRLAEQKIASDPANRPTWIDQAPGLDHAVYRLPVKSGLYSTPEECRHALAVATAQAVAHYGKTYLADADSDMSDVLRRLPAGFGAKVIEQPIYAETVQVSVGPMQQFHALLEFDDDARAQLSEARRQAVIPRRFWWAASCFAAVIASMAVVLAALRLDLASDGKYRGRLRWATALVILLVVGSAWGLCLL